VYHGVVHLCVVLALWFNGGRITGINAIKNCLREALEKFPADGVDGRRYSHQQKEQPLCKTALPGL